MFEIDSESMSDDVRIGIIDHAALAGDKLQLQPHRLDGKQQVGENDRRIHIQNLDGLKRHGRSQIRPLADLKDSVARTDIPVRLQVAAGLPHEPDRPNIRRPPAASI